MGKQQTSPKLVHVEHVCDGWLKKYILHYELPEGGRVCYESISRKGFEDYRCELEAGSTFRGEASSPDAVCIVPRTEKDELVMIREFRYPLNSWCISFPAGLLEEGEDITSCIERELLEETGYRVLSNKGQARCFPLSQAGYSSTGMTEENVLVAYAYVEKQGEPSLEATECIEVFTLAVDDIPQFIEENTEPIGTRCQLVLESFVQEQRWAALRDGVQ